jgi:hypothetical protein
MARLSVAQGPCSAVLPTVHGCHYAFQKFPFFCHPVYTNALPIPVAARSKTWVCGRAHLQRLRVRILLWGIDMSLVSIALSATGLCVGLITHPEKPYQVRCVWVWSWSLDGEESLAHKGLSRHKKNVSALTAIASTSTKWQIMLHSLQFSYLAQLYKLCSVLWRPCVLFLWEPPWLSHVTGMIILHVCFMLRTTSLSYACRLLGF